MPTPRTRRAATPTAPVEEPVVVTPVVADDPIVPFPAIPSMWTASTITAFASGAIAFLLGILTLAGQLLPASTSPSVQAVTGIVTVLAGLVTPIVVFLTRAGVVKAGLAAGLAHEDAIAVSRRI